MTKTQTYRMDAAGETVGQQEATTPSKALKEFWGDDLASQDGRYGKLKDGRNVVALTMAWSRRKLDPQERTTRL